MKKMTQFTAMFVMAVFAIAHTSLVRADDTATTKVENSASDAKTDMKKGSRKMKRKARKATGNDTVGKDAKDSMNDTKDNINNATDKAKNKANQ